MPVVHNAPVEHVPHAGPVGQSVGRPLYLLLSLRANMDGDPPRLLVSIQFSVCIWWLAGNGVRLGKQAQAQVKSG